MKVLSIAFIGSALVMSGTVAAKEPFPPKHPSTQTNATASIRNRPRRAPFKVFGYEFDLPSSRSLGSLQKPLPT
jgi:hypothetical protein